MTLPAGKLAFSRAAPGQNANSEVVLMELPSGTMTEIGAALELCNVRSPAFDATGQYLVVTAASNPSPPDPCPTDPLETEVYYVDTEQLANKNSALAVTAIGGTEGHPAFGTPMDNPSGDYVYFEQAGDLARVPTNLVSPQPFSNCSTPSGSTCFDGGTPFQSYPTATGTTGWPELLCYQEGNGASADIYCVDLSETGALTDPLQDHRSFAISTANVAESHPHFFGGFLYYEQGIAAGSLEKSLVRVAVENIGDMPEGSAFDMSAGESDSDVAVLGTVTAGDVVVFSRSSNSGDKDLYVGVFGKPDVWGLDEFFDTPINTDADEAEAAFSPP